MYKLTVYIPATHLETVKNALFDAGAGRQGAYDRCAWQVLGQGQFRPLTGCSPFIGRVGSVATVDEYRVEMLCPEDRTAAVIRALRAAHPYETPAFDLVRLADGPFDGCCA
jgi:hypothetical protein